LLAVCRLCAGIRYESALRAVFILTLSRMLPDLWAGIKQPTGHSRNQNFSELTFFSANSGGAQRPGGSPELYGTA
jgi:hypothetical protein